jgi:hypothetical protein
MFIRFLQGPGAATPRQGLRSDEARNGITGIPGVTRRADCPNFSEDIHRHLSLSGQNRTNYIPLTSA